MQVGSQSHSPRRQAGIMYLCERHCMVQRPPPTSGWRLHGGISDRGAGASGTVNAWAWRAQHHKGRPACPATGSCCRGHAPEPGGPSAGPAAPACPSRRLALMKPEALLINVSRGGLVQTRALIDALQEGRLAGCAMDVYGEGQQTAQHAQRAQRATCM